MAGFCTINGIHNAIQFEAPRSSVFGAAWISETENQKNKRQEIKGRCPGEVLHNGGNRLGLITLTHRAIGKHGKMVNPQARNRPIRSPSWVAICLPTALTVTR